MSADLAEPATLRGRALETVEWDQVRLEELTEYILKAYATTPADQRIHGWDPLVSDRETIMRWLRASREEHDRLSIVPECCRIAVIDGQPAGFSSALLHPKQSIGIIGYLGVLPEFRRQGIARSLLASIHDHLRKRRCRYALVGTPETNHQAIQLYTNAGYQPILHQVELYKILRN